MVSVKLFSPVLGTLLILSIVAGSTGAFAQTQTSATTAKPTQSITQIIANDTNFTTLARLLTKANLTGINFPPGNYTFFAPTDAAFEKLGNKTLTDLTNNKTALVSLLKYHIVPTGILASNFSGGSGTLSTLNPNGAKIEYSVSGTTIKVDDATVIKKDIVASNGMIQVINGVMIPPTTETSTASASAAGGFLGLPGFEALYAVAGLLIVAYLVIRRRK